MSRLTERLHLGHVISFGVAMLLLTWGVARAIRRIGLL